MITGQQVLVNFQVETKEGRGEVRVSSIEQNRPWSWVVLFRKLRDDEWPWKRRRDTSSPRLEPGQLYITTCSIATRRVYFSRTRYRYECEESDRSSKARIELSSIDVNTRVLFYDWRESAAVRRTTACFVFVSLISILTIITIYKSGAVTEKSVRKMKLRNNANVKRLKLLMLAGRTR